jgi:hypothetical protein
MTAVRQIVHTATGRFVRSETACAALSLRRVLAVGLRSDDGFM